MCRGCYFWSGPTVVGQSLPSEKPSPIYWFARSAVIASYVIKRGMTDSFTDARRRQLRLGGAKPPVLRAAMALAKSQAYQDAADAHASLCGRPRQLQGLV
jgi:hypothetical protein